MNNRFINIIENLKSTLQVSDELFQCWILEVTSGFEKKNYWALEKRIVQNMDGVNSRCVLDELANTQELSRHTNQEILSMKRKLDESAREISELRREVKMLKESQVSMEAKVDKLLDIIINQNSPFNKGSNICASNAVNFEDAEGK